MGWKSKAAAIVLLTMGAGGVSTSALADGACSSTCDDHHVACMQAGKSDDGVCLPQWRQCKATCSGSATKSVSPVAQPIKVTTTTTIQPGAKGSKVVATKTVIAKH